MRKGIFFFVVFIFGVYGNAQEQLGYKSKSSTTEFIVSPNEFYVEFESKDVAIVKTIGRGRLRSISSHAVIVKQEGLAGDFSSRKEQLNNLFSNIFHRIEPVLVFSDGAKQMTKGEINIQIKKGYKVEEVIRGYDFEVKPLFIEDNLFTLSSEELTTLDLFSRIEVFERDERVEFAEPNFIREITFQTADPYFSSQWAIKNQGYSGGTVGADMKVEQAWNYATGSGVKVAIIDEGVDLNHPDLQTNLLPGFDATGGDLNGGPAFFPLWDTTGNTPPDIEPTDPPHDDYHGTACAGIVAAVANNNIGIAGAAYNAKIIPVRIAYSNGFPLEDVNNRKWVTTDTWMASGITWAWQNGADILSNSWTYGGSNSSAIAGAITNAVNNGRNGKGALVLASTGNNNSYVKLPASLNNVIAVGASSPCDTPKTPWSCDGEDWGSNSGQGLNVLAPGVKIYTTDLSGAAGKSTSDYVSDFKGTSASCAYAAAVCALILSLDTNLTGTQVRNILESTCDKIGGFSYTTVSGQPNGTWFEDAGYGRVNACAAVLMTSLGIEPLLNTTITTNTTLSTDKFVGGELIVESGATLTITSKIRFADNAKVIIKPGARLIVNGGKLTNTEGCGTFWQGIEVWGTTTQHQFPENNPTYQGYLQLINGGTIENAQNGARNWKPEDWGKIGGVIISDGGIFKNNRRAVEFISYENFSSSNPSIKRGNHSSFTNTDFIWDDNFISGQTYNTMVTMWLVDGINFTNCRFSNLMTGAKTLFGSQNRAIYSIDAGYSILPGCSWSSYPCPTGNLLKSTFTGFKEAVVATGSGTTKTLTISRSTFTNNLLAVDIDDFDNISVDRNSITSGLAGYIFPLSIGGTGIYIRNSTGYIVEENTLTTAMSGRTTYGIRVENSGTANNRLYKNTMTGLSYGQHLTGINRNALTPLVGLQFLCNTYTNNTTATYIGSTGTHGVALSQAVLSPLKSAGNIFTNNTTAISNAASAISYYHSGGNTIPTVTSGSVTLYSTGKNFCLSSFGGIIVMKGQSGAALDSLEQQKYNSKMMYDELMYNYLSLLDGGNTEDLKSKIENSWPEDAWLLRGKLLEKSPYLSQEVLLEAAKSGVLPNAMLLEICLANPDATRNVYFVDKLNEATNGTFPDYMKEYISSNDKKTVRTQLELQLAALSSSISSTKHFISNIKATAQEYTYTDRYALVTSGNELSDKISQIDFFMENNQWVKADSVLQTIYEDKKQQDHLKLIENFDIYIAFRSGLGERNLAQLDDSEIVFLQNLAEREGRIAGYAKNILCFFYQICYDEQKLLENDSQKMMMKPQQQLQNLPPLEELTYVLNVYPNPAKEYTNLQWEILDELNSCHYKVHDLSGLLISEGIITQNKGEASIDTRNIKNGMYIISVFNGSELKTTRKLVVEKIK